MKQEIRLSNIVEYKGQGVIQRPLALYVHIPFCIAKCGYCDFLSFSVSDFADKKGVMEKYVSALCREIEHLPHPYATLDSIYIGGGTPSILPPGAIPAIMRSICSRYRLADNCEITMETNPGTLDTMRLSEYREAGINRISMGIQSLDDEVLRQSSRIHNAEEGILGFQMLRAAGFANVNLDLIVGLPGNNADNMERTLEKVLALHPEHISLYALILEKGTSFYIEEASGRLRLPEDEETLFMQRRSIVRLEDAGYNRYEISNFARSGYNCRHNMHVWRGGEYLAAGLGASSALYGDAEELYRFKNVTDLVSYMDKVECGEEVRVCEEKVNREEQMFERLMLGLRLKDGVDDGDFFNRFGISLKEVYAEAIESNQEEGLLYWEDNHLLLTDKGMEWQNQVLLAFMQ